MSAASGRRWALATSSWTKHQLLSLQTVRNGDVPCVRPGDLLRVSKALTAELLLRRFRLPSGAGGRGLAANGRLWLMLRLHLPRLCGLAASGRLWKLLGLGCLGRWRQLRLNRLRKWLRCRL